VIDHPLEEKFNASAWDILSAIERGFRAQVDVKGKLAEYFLFQQLERLKQSGVLETVDWQDKDGQPDFLLGVRGRVLRVECKNVRSVVEPAQPRRRRSRAIFVDLDAPPGSPLDLGAAPQRPYVEEYRVELQKTRNSKDGTPTRGYRATEFELLAACLFNRTGRWEYLFIANGHLARRQDNPEFLVIMQPVPMRAEGPWRSDIVDAIHDVRGR